MYTNDGNLRNVSIDEIVPGMLLRSVNSDGSSAPFSDVVVTKVYIEHGEKRFDADRPYAFNHFGGALHGSENVKYLGINSLKFYKLIMLASGKPYMMNISR